jgi:hypothetical protein
VASSKRSTSMPAHGLDDDAHVPFVRGDRLLGRRVAQALGEQWSGWFALRFAKMTFDSGHTQPFRYPGLDVLAKPRTANTEEASTEPILQALTA